MNALDALIREFEKEITTTRKMLSVVPAEKFDWAPHEKSMKLGPLTTHVAEIPTWFGMILNTDELDFEKEPYSPKVFTTTAELLAYFEECAANGLRDLQAGKSVDLEKIWTIRNGEMIFSAESKWDSLRHTMSQIIHHRAQLGVFLRLLNVPIPGSYGPSADDQSF
jgi:uncharacterized damage-inducible protein DinB